VGYDFFFFFYNNGQGTKDKYGNQVTGEINSKKDKGNQEILSKIGKYKGPSQRGCYQTYHQQHNHGQAIYDHGIMGVALCSIA